MELIPKIGIIVGIAALVILTPLFAISMYLQNQYEFAQLLVDSDETIQLLKTQDSYKNFLDRYPDAIVHEQNGRNNPNLEISAFDGTSGNQLILHISYDVWDERVNENADCRVEDRGYRQQLDSMAETPMTIPKSFYKQGNAHDHFTADFIKYTNCLEMTNEDKFGNDVKPAAYVAIPVGTGTPDCAENNECYNPFVTTVNVGDSVEWQNFDEAAHTVTSGDTDDGPDGEFDTGLFMSQESYKVQFDTAGEYPYFCMVHPWMTGTVIVIDAVV